MFSFVARRILVSILTLLVASFIMYNLTAYAGDPIGELRASNALNKDQLIAKRTELLQLDVPPPLRWLYWLGGVAGCAVPAVFECTLGSTLEGLEVAQLLPRAMGSTVRLVSVATVLAIVLGVVVGMVTALRRNSAFDIGVTFISFFLYSLPSFLIAVLLKEFGAIGFNNFLQKGDPPQFSVGWIIGITLVSGLIWALLLADSWTRRLIVFASAAAVTAGVLLYMNLSNFFEQPAFGPVLMFIILGLSAIGMLALGGQLRQRRAIIAAGVTALIAYICYFALQPLFDVSTGGTIAILAVVTVVVSGLVGYLSAWGEPEKRPIIRTAIFTGLLTASFVLFDRYLQAWPAYLSDRHIKGRPMATAQAATTGFSSDMWGHGIDTTMHFLLPTLSLTLMSFAFYTRFARAGLLEVFNQDYIRTARAKGLSERTVVMRHAFRNMLIPLTTLVAADVGGLLGGALITERVFAISGMGALFNQSLANLDLSPIMGYFLVVAALAILFNFIADLLYAVMDPRVRVK